MCPLTILSNGERTLKKQINTNTCENTNTNTITNCQLDENVYAYHSPQRWVDHRCSPGKRLFPLPRHKVVWKQAFILFASGLELWWCLKCWWCKMSEKLWRLKKLNMLKTLKMCLKICLTWWMMSLQESCCTWRPKSWGCWRWPPSARTASAGPPA